jgi:peptidoglycan hydrolase-like protein with peptidoglycan-binding domain
MDEDKKGKGFAGLSSLTSKIEDHTSFESSKRQPNPDSSKVSAQKKSEPSVPLESSTTTSSQPKKPPPKKMLSGWKWLLGVITVVGIAAVYNSNQQSKSPSIPSTYTPPSSSYGTGTGTGTTSIKPEIVPKQNLKPVRPVLKLTFQKPPLGRDNVLSVEQIRWCQREDIRLGVKKNLIKNNSHVSEFNRSVDDYNRRCGNFRYRRGSLERAKSDVEKLRLEIEREASLQFQPRNPQFSQTTRDTSGTYSSPKEDTKIKRVLSDKTSVTEAQSILTHLGYKPGPVDGQFGSKTDKAIRMFQTKSGLKIDGKITGELLINLRKLLPKATPASAPSIHFSLGDTQTKVSHVQGAPDDISTYRSLGHETWRYGKSSVEFSIKTKRVISWTNKGNLKSDMPYGSNVTNSPFFSRGSHKDQVAKIQGSPDEVAIWDKGRVMVWKYGSSDVKFSTQDNLVVSWTNKGELKLGN